MDAAPPPAPPPPESTAGAWIGFLVVAYAGAVVALNAVLHVGARLVSASTELIGLQVALQTVDEAETYGFEVLAELEQVGARHAEALATEALVAGAAGLVLLLCAIGFTRGRRVGLRGAQLLLLIKVTQAVALAWLIGWRLGPEAVDVLRDVRATFGRGRGGGDWEAFDALTADDGVLRAGAVAVGFVTALPALLLFWLSFLRVSKRWCGIGPPAVSAPVPEVQDPA